MRLVTYTRDKNPEKFRKCERCYGLGNSYDPDDNCNGGRCRYCDGTGKELIDKNEQKWEWSIR